MAYSSLGLFVTQHTLCFLNCERCVCVVSKGPFVFDGCCLKTVVVCFLSLHLGHVKVMLGQWYVKLEVHVIPV